MLTAAGVDARCDEAAPVGDSSKTRKVGKFFANSAFSGQFQTQMQYCFPDSVGDKSEYVNRFLSNSYLDLRYTSTMVDLGVRIEAYENPLPGFERDYKGFGVPYFYLTVDLGAVQLTAGDFYEQFGSGLILRTYYERTLGVDNALRGGRVVARPTRWMTVKALAGQQRYYWQHSPTWIGGADAAIDFDKIFPKMKHHYLQWGAGWVSKWENPTTILTSPTEQLNLPKATAAFSTRLRYQDKHFTVQGEYAYKINDPSADNGYIYRPGQALILSASYATKGFGATLSAKHNDNMSFRSQRDEQGRMLQINYLPAFTYQHSYSLAAMYPYATQSDGEVGFQADIYYKIPKNSALGGKYGTDIRANFSRINSLAKSYNNGRDNGTTAPVAGTYGYRSSLFAVGGELYYQDINIDISHRFSRGFKMSLLYMNQIYNQAQIEGHGTNGDIVYANIVALEATIRLSNRVSLRAEGQYLFTAQDLGDWASALIELSVAPGLIFTLSDVYNVGDTRKNYLLGAVAYSSGSHRVELSAGQQRAGITCVGGICRYVPQTNGVGISYIVNFSTR